MFNAQVGIRLLGFFFLGDNMALKMFNALLPYFGGKRKLCPVIFGHIAKHIPRGHWQGATFVDGFLGSGAVGLYAKAQGFRVIANDIAERSYIAGQALIENDDVVLRNEDIFKLFLANPDNSHFIEKEFVPDVFTEKHAVFLDNAFLNARRPIDKYLLIKYIFHIRPYSKFSSPNAFNRPMADGRFDEIKQTYNRAIHNTLNSSLNILKIEKNRINAGIFSNGFKNEVYKEDVFDFINRVSGEVLYLDPPYSNTLSYESEYGILDKILGGLKQKSRFSSEGGMEVLDELLAHAGKFPLWVISFGNAGGKNELSKLVEIVSKYRKCEAKEFEYRHCEAMASEAHKEQCREWLIIGWR